MKKNVLQAIAILALAAMLFAAMPVLAAEDETAPPDAEDAGQSAPAEDEFQAPKLTGSVDQQVQQLTDMIEKLQAQVDELVFAKETAKRDRIKRQIVLLKRQLKQLLVQQQLSNRSQLEKGEEAIRREYGQRIQVIEAQKAADRKKTISQFEDLLERTQTSPSKANIIFRLGLLYFEDDHYNYEQQQMAYMGKVDQIVQQGGDPDIGPEPQSDYSRSKNKFQEVITDYPNFDRSDFAHYMLAYCLTAEDDLPGAIAAYSDLITKFPNSEFVPEAHIRKGELLFDENEMRAAIEEYKAVLQFPDSKFYDKALFKLGWSYYRLTVDDETALRTAIDYFTEVLEYYANRPQMSLRGGDDLRQESVDYIAISFTDMDDTGYEEALAFIQKHPKYEWNKDILTKMGEVYIDRDRYDVARKIILDRIQRWPEDAANPSIHMKIIDALVEMGLYEEAITEGERLATLYGPGSQWAQANQENTGVIEKAQKMRAKLLYASATHHHEQAQLTKKREGAAAAAEQFTKAAQSYEAFLGEFTDAKDSFEARFNLAECYFEIRAYDRACDNYQMVIAQGGKMDLSKDKDKKELFAGAVKNVVYSREQQFLADPGWPVKPPAPGTEDQEGKGARADIQTVPLSPQAERWVQAMQQHLDSLPDDKDSPTVMFKMGEVYFYHGQFDRSTEVLKKQIATYPESEAAQVAMNLVIQALDKQGKYEELRVVAADYRNRVTVKVIDKDKNITNVEALDMIRTTAEAKLAEKKIEEGDYQGGIDLYLSLVQANPRSDQAPVALNNAAVAYVKMGRVYEANDLYFRIAKEYPDFERAKQNLMFAATQFEKLVDIERAVDTYEFYATNYPDDDGAKDALYNAALLRENNKDYSEAIGLYREYLTRYPNVPDAVEVAFTICRLQKEMGNDQGAEMAYEDFTRNYTDAVYKTRAYLEWGKLAENRGDVGEAIRHYQQAAAVYQQAAQIDPAAGAPYAAEAMFKIAQIDYDLYAGITLSGTEDMGEQLRNKALAYKNLSIKYKEILQLGDFEYATAALYMIGKINKDFADTLFSAPIPEGLSPEEQDLYIVKLEEQGFPLKQQSMEAFETNIQKGRTEKARNEWIDKSYDELKEWKPELSEEKYELFMTDTATSLPSPSFGISTSGSAPSTQEGAQ